MKPRRFSYTLAALDADGFAAGLTGVGPWTTFSAPADGTAHQVTIANSADMRTYTFTVTGTDANGNSQTESIAGPNATTATLTNYFKTITRISVSATIGVNTIDVGWTALCQTPVFVTDHAKLTGPVVSAGIGGSITYTLQQTATPIFDTTLTPAWQTLGSAGASANSLANAQAGTTAVRCTVASHTSGVLTLDISQARQ